MPRTCLPSIRRLIAALAWLLFGHGAAQAGLVSGRWDPAFGAFLPGLNWGIQAEFLVNNDCSNLPDGVYSTASGDCAGAVTQHFYLRLYNNLANPSDFFANNANSRYLDLHALSVSANGGYVVSEVRVLNSQVVGFTAGFTGLNSSPVFAQYLVPSEALSYAFGASLGVNRARVVCYQCGLNSVDVEADFSGLTQYLVTYVSADTSHPKFTDANGNAIGTLLDQNGSVVPEPASLALGLAALVAAALARRRR